MTGPQAMIFKVYLMRRGGRKLSWRDTINGPAFVGDLTLANVASRNCEIASY